MQRINVDFPHPDGPISAVAWLAATFRLMSYSAWPLPYQAFRFSTWIPTPIIYAAPKRAAANREAHGRNRSDDKNDEHQRSCPRLPVQIIIGRGGVFKNLKRQRGGGLIQTQSPGLAMPMRIEGQAPTPELIAQTR